MCLCKLCKALENSPNIKLAFSQESISDITDTNNMLIFYLSVLHLNLFV
jgi:hypothetical protein